ncbi:MAG TPA: ParB/RepB/Spo0J family partition protein [Pyrinomonadaceae bacterium]|nr:ParB/RepB/Spo0J family partition protein [Pyrinomonadaceae bacterium]
MTRKPLGRGLGALLSADQTSKADEQNEIAIESIVPSSMQPRTRFDEGPLQDLANSIKANGVVQPLLVRQKGREYELIAGERRWRAAQLAGLTHVPVVVRDVPDEKVLELALIENIQREDLNPIEEAQAYRRLIDSIGLTQESLAERVGRDRSYITNFLRLLRLPQDLQHLIEEGKLSTGHARTLLGASDADNQRRIARKIIERGLSVRETERLVRELTEASAKPHKARSKENDPNVRAAETKLRRHLGTQVRIVQNQAGVSGRIEIEFYNPADLERLFRLLIPLASPAHSAAVQGTSQ